MESLTIKSSQEELLVNMIEQGEIQQVVVIIPLLGNVYQKSFSASFFLKNVLNNGFKFPEVVPHFNIECNLIQNENIGLQSVNDCMMEIDKSTIRMMSWMGKEYAVCMGIYKEYNSEELHWAYPRNILTKSLKRIGEKHGVYFLGASELEFYILNNRPDEITKDYPAINLEKCKISTRNSDYCVGTIQSRYETFNKKIKENLDDCGITVESLFTEHGPGQHEINIKYGPILKNCDDHIYLKQNIKHTACEMGKTASFMAKTFMNQDGSSCHVHLSAYAVSGGKNVFAPSEVESENFTIDTGDKRNPSVKCNKKMIHFIGGIIKYLEELFLVYAPNVNSYKRFKKNTFAPTCINTWCYDSRTASVRVIGSGDSLHLEIRVAGADANPFLLFTAILESGMKGIEDKVDPPAMEIGNVYEKSGDHLKYAPKSLIESILLFSKSEFASQIFGEKMKQTMLDFANQEWDDFLNHISNWEVNRYLDLV